MAVISSRLDLIIRRLRAFRDDDRLERFFMPREQALMLLEGIEELKQTARRAPDP
jgi:hypothetical protein